MGFKDLIIAFPIVAIFSLALIMFGVNLGLDNGSDQNILDDERLARFNETLRGQLDDFSQTTNSSRQQFETQGEKEDDEGFSINPFRIIIGLYSSTIAFAGLMFAFLIDMVGLPGILLNVVAGIIIILIIILAWRVWKVGGT